MSCVDRGGCTTRCWPRRRLWGGRCVCGLRSDVGESVVFLFSVVVGLQPQHGLVGVADVHQSCCQCDDSASGIGSRVVGVVAADGLECVEVAALDPGGGPVVGDRCAQSLAAVDGRDVRCGFALQDLLPATPSRGRTIASRRRECRRRRSAGIGLEVGAIEHQQRVRVRSLAWVVIRRCSSTRSVSGGRCGY